MPFKLTREQKEALKEKLKYLTTGDNSLSKRAACKLLSKEYNVSQSTVYYHGTPSEREKARKREADRRKRPDIAAKQRDYHREAYHTDEQTRQRQLLYAKLRRSYLAKEILPRAFQRAGKESVHISHLVDLVEQETEVEGHKIRMQESTLIKLLRNRYQGIPRGPPSPLEEISEGRYRLNPGFYE
jgi:hypothetical protein